jgi:pyruvate,water dikinase
VKNGNLSYIFWFEELGQEHNDLVGKKCANLGEMTRRGLPVPPGFALSVEAYKSFMSSTGAVHEIKKFLNKSGINLKDIQCINTVSEGLRRIVEAKAMPGEMKESIISCYRKLSLNCHSPDVAVATRSAGAASHPGQYETYLNVKGESDLIEKIKKVWSSTFNPRSLSFRFQKGLDLETDPIGVAVLKMVKARAAGVGFTADPNTGDPSKILIEASWGLGESVVNGTQTPDHYVIDKQSLVVEDSKIAVKLVEIMSDSRGGTSQQQVPAERQQAPVLSQDELKRLAEFGKTLELGFGSPQDFEWVIDADMPFPGNILLVQSRPVKMARSLKTPVEEIIDLMVDRAMRRY